MALVPLAMLAGEAPGCALDQAGTGPFADAGPPEATLDGSTLDAGFATDGGDDGSVPDGDSGLPTVTFRAAAPATALTPHLSMATGYDQAHQRVIAYGGMASYQGAALGDTWSWDGNTWLDENPSASPPVLSSAAMAYDSTRKAMILFGGEGKKAASAATWQYDGTTWLQLSPSGAPSARIAPALAQDATGTKLVLFGGSTAGGNGDLGDTWIWNGASWIQASPAVSPPARAYSAMFCDGTQVVLFGGLSAGGTPLSDTWLWDGSTWQAAVTAAHPSARYGHMAAYDSTRSVGYLFGGNDASGAYPTDAWLWGTAGWRLSSTALPPGLDGRAMGAVVFDAARAELMLFSGYNGAALGLTWLAP